MVDLRADPDTPGAWLLPIKAVPGARRNTIVGPLGTRLKVRIAAPPEDGKANRAIRRLIADALGLRPSKDLWWSSNRQLGRYGKTWSKSAEHSGRAGR